MLSRRPKPSNLGLIGTAMRFTEIIIATAIHLHIGTLIKKPLGALMEISASHLHLRDV
jgi:hypothetical protein